MKLTQPEVETNTTTGYNIGRLQTWLDYEISVLPIWLIGYFYFHIIFYIIVAATIAAVIFIPFLLKTLIEVKRYGWIISFFIFIAIPPVIVYFAFSDMTWTTVAGLSSLGFFYFYCGILRLVIREW